MDLKTFGDGLQFGMELESTSQRVYEQMVNSGLQIGPQEVMRSFAQACKKRRNYLEMLFKESICSDMDTGVFQPIGSLDSNRYAVEGAHMYAAVPDVFGSIMIAEEKMRLFYIDFAAEIKSNRNAVSQRLRKMAEENSCRASKLSELKSR